MDQIICSVSGIQNKEQKTQIKNSLNRVDGVQEVGINLMSGAIDIKYNAPATARELKNCIENAGFKIVYE